MFAHPPGPADQPGKRAFSLVELLVAMVVLSLLLVLLGWVSDQVMRSWRQAGARAEFSSQARAALDIISRRLSQATLSPYLAYDNPTNPRRYIRKSNLRFLIEPASDLLGTDFGPGSAIFFQAPLGRASDINQRQLVGLLNTCGFYIRKAAPPSLSFGPSAEERYLLMEFQVAAELLAPLLPVPDPARPALETSAAWAADLVSESPTRAYERELAANVILFLARPLRSDPAGRPEDFAGRLAYSSAAGTSLDPQPATANQLPPYVEIILVVLSEESAARFGSSGINITTGFENPATLDMELDSLASQLSARGLQFRILRTSVALPNSRWQG